MISKQEPEMAQARLHRRRELQIAFYVVLLLIVLRVPASAEEPQNTQQQNGEAPSAQDAAAKNAVNSLQICRNPAGEIVVKDAYHLDYANRRDHKKSRRAGLNEIILIDVDNLGCLVAESKCAPPFKEGTDCRPKKIALYIDGREMAGLEPESGAPTLDKPGTVQARGTLRYHLQRDSATTDGAKAANEHWADLLGLGSDIWNSNWRERGVQISVGLADEYPVRTEVKGDRSFSLVRIRGFRLAIWIALTLVFILFLFLLGRKYDILRDHAPVLWKQKRPYSLSSIQAAWWFIVILLSFIFIWLVTDQHDFSSTALILLSIGLGTALAATVIDSNKKGETKGPEVNSAELNVLLSKKQKIETELTNLETRLQSNKTEALQKEFADKKKEYDDLIAEIDTKFPKAIGPAHENFLLDILSDANGVSFHRFQMLGWTIVMGILFAHAVLSRLAMPEFSNTLLGLMGISAGSYIGFKIPENNNITTQPTDQTAASNPQEGASGGGNGTTPPGQ